MAVFEQPSWFRPAFARWYRWLLPQIAMRSKHVVTVSEFSKRELLKHILIRPEKISVIPSAVSEELIRAEPFRPPGLTFDTFLLMVGSHDPRKNMEFAIGALQDWCIAHKTGIVIAGNSGRAFAGDETKTRLHVQQLKGISDPELNWLYRNARAVVHPSLYEGFSLVPIEAQTLGTPCVLSDIPAHREVISSEAHFFDLNSVQSLITAVEQALSSERKPTTSPYRFEKSALQWEELILKMQH